MSEYLGWLITHIGDERDVVSSIAPPEVILERIGHRVSPRPPMREEMLAGLPGKTAWSGDLFANFKSDFDSRGDDAMRARRLWGLVSGTRFWFEVATGYGAQMWLIPILKGVVTPNETGGSIIRYRLRAVQRPKCVVLFGGFGLGLLFACLGIFLLASGAPVVGGLLALGFGVVAMFSILYAFRNAARVAEHMARYLKTIIQEVAKR